MNLLTDSVKKIYLKYLLFSFGSAIIVSIYSTVDAVVIGQYEGAAGSAALSCIMPMWSMFMSLSILVGIGGSILMSTSRGSGNERRSDEFFTSCMIVACVASIALVFLFIFFRDDFLRFCGADEAILPLAMAYTKWLTYGVPFFLIGNVFAAFVRNDNAPQLATTAVVAGGLLNIPGDLFFVFGLDWGIAGAGFATSVSQVLACIILSTHFFSKSNKLHFVEIEPAFLVKRTLLSLKIGFAPFIVDFSFGITVMLFNNQIMKYAGHTELAVYGAVVNVAILIQSIFYGVGQAVQPPVSENNGAHKTERVHSFLRLSLLTAGIMSIGFAVCAELFPAQILHIYMKVSSDVLAAGPSILRKYSISFLFVGINVVSSYYLQAVLKSVSSLIISLLRGCILCVPFILLLPAIGGVSFLWYAMPLAELFTFIVTAILLRKNISKA
jgi:putative MATE family efflux protein